LLFLMARCAAQVAPATIEPSDPSSARAAAHELLGHLAQGRIEAAAALSNAPERRLEVLREYRAAIGDKAFRRVFAEYLDPANRVVAELALGRHRLLVWELAGAGGRIAGQYYVEADGGFLMDDRPSEARSRLQRALEDYRARAGR
jgi:hypothetical protein